ncbi:UNVERIFIED_CONTAM: hypothetical protein GTU68_064603, partial [Idotea baltica]|nr:hypothetical protein [Idotea baltica]
VLWPFVRSGVTRRAPSPSPQIALPGLVREIAQDFKDDLPLSQCPLPSWLFKKPPRLTWFGLFRRHQLAAPFHARGTINAQGHSVGQTYSWRTRLIQLLFSSSSFI